MPTTATADELSRCGIVLMLRRVTASVCESHLTLVPPQRVSNPQTHRAGRWQDSRQRAKQYGESGPNRDVTIRQNKHRQQAMGGVAAEGDPQPRDPEPDASADDRQQQ